MSDGEKVAIGSVFCVVQLSFLLTLYSPFIPTCRSSPLLLLLISFLSVSLGCFMLLFLFSSSFPTVVQPFSHMLSFFSHFPRLFAFISSSPLSVLVSSRSYFLIFISFTRGPCVSLMCVISDIQAFSKVSPGRTLLRLLLLTPTPFVIGEMCKHGRHSSSFLHSRCVSSPSRHTHTGDTHTPSV